MNCMVVGKLIELLNYPYHIWSGDCRINYSIDKTDGRRIVPKISILNVLEVGLSIEHVAKLLPELLDFQIFA